MNYKKFQPAKVIKTGPETYSFAEEKKGCGKLEDLEERRADIETDIFIYGKQTDKNYEKLDKILKRIDKHKSSCPSCSNQSPKIDVTKQNYRSKTSEISDEDKPEVSKLLHASGTSLKNQIMSFWNDEEEFLDISGEEVYDLIQKTFKKILEEIDEMLKRPMTMDAVVWVKKVKNIIKKEGGFE